MKQPNLGYADVKLNFACMHPACCARRVSLCDYFDLCVADLGPILVDTCLLRLSFDNAIFSLNLCSFYPS